ncbi:tape-measure protein [Streptomyces sp. NBC_00103]|uniref:tape-measure protein n=1 Tax=Streptomyces sp. NBC_00103 TaxID=2975653 RepID=UPI0022521B7D|nr:tape-measure protein [Streptomyces sp. NBC_00103]MCX5368630.1 tape-measure protein [Streptomyces sp. NBC_00103]
MSTAALPAGGGAADLFAGVAPALQAFRSRLGQNTATARSLVGRIRSAATGVDAVRSAASQGATAVRQVKTGADAASRSVAKTGQTATAAASGIKSAGTRAKGAGKSLGTLSSAFGGVLAIVGALIEASGVLGDLMGAFGTAMTIGSGVMLVVNALTRANPIGFVTGLLLPVAGWLIDLALNSETGQRLMEQLATLVLKYVEGYLTVMTPLLKGIASAVNTYVTGYLAVITTALTVIGTLLGTGFAVMKALTTGDTRALSGKVSSVWRGFKDAVRPALEWITRDVPRMFTRIKEATSRTLDAMGRFVTTGTQTVAGVVKGPIQGLIAFANWVIDGLNSLSFSILGKKFGIHLDKIPMLAEGGIAVPGASRGAGRVLPLTALERQRVLARRRRAATSQPPHRVKEFHESERTGARGTAEDLLFLAAAHACA